MDNMTDRQIRTLLAKDCKRLGSQRAWAVAHRIDPAFVCRVLRGDKPPSDRILAALGIEKSYRRVKQ